MELQDFRKDFLETVLALAAAEGDFEEASFVAEACRRLVEAEELADFEPCHFQGTGSRSRKMRIDGFGFDDVDGSVSLVVADYSGSDAAPALTQTDATRSFGLLRTFVEDAVSGRLHQTIEESSPGYGLAIDLHLRQQEITRFRAFLLTDAVLSSRVKDWPEDAMVGRPVEFHIWDVARFHRVFESGVGRDELEVDFTEFVEGGIPCLDASQADGEYDAYLCVIPGGVLSDIYDRYGSRLLEGNVRSFLSTRGKVNKNIRTSILNEPGMFFVYNNGIAATATNATAERVPHGLRLLRATDLQIVNGGQTTVSLAAARRKDRAELAGIFIQMKLSVVTPARAEEVIPRIAYCANSQNKVSDADFFSNHPFHVRIEDISRRIWAPATGGAQHETHWFYERARGQYLNAQVTLTPAEKRRFVHQNPRQQVITKTDLAKYENAWRGLPHTVSLGAQKNFLKFAEWVGKRWTQSPTDFNEEFFKNAVARAIIFRHTERLVSRQPWYQGGYRANIVAYTVARLVSLIETWAPGRALDLRAIWARQDVTPALDAQLAVVAGAVFDVIVAPQHGFQNVTEWCKKEICWQRVCESDVRLVEELIGELAGQDEVRAVRREARARQRVDSGIEAQTEVVNLGAEYWSTLDAWARQRNLLSGRDESLVGVAARMPASIPTDRQSAALLEIRDRMETEGFQGG
ncbi:MAG: AIPR family protein [Nitrospirae bacterium]|nr:AIPR family protein [Nitrospirota bacterium]